MDWSKYPNFTREEMQCKHTGKDGMRPEFMEWLQKLRLEFNRPFIITSAFRDITHPIEAKKEQGGSHSKGCAVDIAIRGEEALRLIALAYSMGCRRIGVQQKGSSRFIHLDLADQLAGFPASIWSY